MTTITTRPVLPGEPATDAERNALSWMETILSLWDAHQWALDRRSTCDGLNAETLNILDETGLCERDDNDCLPWDEIAEAVRERAQESVLSVEVRSAWHVPGSQPDLDQFRITLTFGGPWCAIIGEVDALGCAFQPDVWFQEMGIAKDRLALTSAQRSALEWFALQFYFGS